VGLLLCLAAPALAQSGVAGQSGRRTEGIFGSGVGDTGHSLIFTGQVGGGVDQLWIPETTGVEEPADFDETARFGHWSGNLQYALSRQRAAVSISAGSSGRHYPDSSGRDTLSTAVSGVGQVSITARTLLDGSFSATERPASLLSLNYGLPEGLLPSDYAAGSVDYRTYQGQLGVSRQLTRRSTLAVGYGQREITSSQPSATRDRSSRTGFVRYTHSLSEAWGVRLGYGRTSYEAPRTDGLEPLNTTADNVDVGIDFADSLALSRRTTLEISSGSVYASDGERDLFTVVGRVALTREMGRSWFASLGYSRSLGYVETYADPTLVDEVSGSVSGLMGRRVQFSSGAGVSRGTVGFADSEDRHYVTYWGQVGISTALNRFLGIRADYSVGRYRFDQFVVPDAFGVPSVRYQSVRVGLDLWAPLWTRAGRP